MDGSLRGRVYEVGIPFPFTLTLKEINTVLQLTKVQNDCPL